MRLSRSCAAAAFALVAACSGSTEPDAITAQLDTIDATGISGHVVMDPATRRANKPAALVQMDGTEFTCLGQPDFPDYVPAVK